MIRRTVPEIMAEILLFCKEPQPKTRIMINSNLSYKMLGRYLSQLQSFGLLETPNSEFRYASTLKGFDFVNKWSDLMDLLAVPQEHKGPLMRTP